MKVSIDRETTTPIYMQIFEQIRRQIISGELVTGYRLPPERKLAERLDVNRSTVLNAYRELKAEGLVGSKVGNGTIVLSHLRDGQIQSNIISQEPAWNQIFNSSSMYSDSYILKDLLMLASRKDVISFATGIASPEAGPIEVFKGIEEELVTKRNYKAMLHSPTEGFASFRNAICSLMHKRGVYCNADEVMVLSGSQQGIDLVARVMLDPGDIVVVEEPTFFPAIQAFKTKGARVMGIPMDDKGMRVDLLEQLLQRYKPKLIYTIPTYHNPTGIEMELERRKKLVELAYRYRVIIVEDDAYGDLCYDGCPTPMLKSMDNEGYVIYLSTFSKNVYSGLRLGWMVAHRKAVKKFTESKQIMDLHSSSLSQWVVERFITSGGLDAYIPKVCTEYRHRRDAMYDALERYAPPGLVFDKPRGGYYMWCRLPGGISAAGLVAKAAEKSIVFVPGSSFFTTGQGDDFIRLNFTFAAFKDIAVGIRRLCEAIKEMTYDVDRNAGYSGLEINPIV